jgi:hypothetical protein
VTEAHGQLLADADTGAPLAAELRAVYDVPGEQPARAEVSASFQLKAIGSAVASVRAPEGALPDVRKPKGVARALEQAGLKKEREKKDAGEPGDDAGEAE